VERGLQPLGVVLAGGAGARLGGSKAMVELGGRPLISYPLAAFAAAGIGVVVVAKAATTLPRLDVPVLLEPDEPTHPLLGLVTALAHAGSTPIVASPCDTPFVTAALLAALARSPGTAVVHDGGRLHPLLARYRPTDLPTLQQGLEADSSATSTAESLSPTLIESSPGVTFNLNTPEDLATATARLAD
jgi:molybdopterin-guanine dinucleotide biosynthesis protein A